MTTAALLGHANTHVLMQTYGQLLKDQAFMREAAKRVRQGAPASKGGAKEASSPPSPRKKKGARESENPKT